jgi:hypothetical protein
MRGREPDLVRSGFQQWKPRGKRRLPRQRQGDRPDPSHAVTQGFSLERFDDGVMNVSSVGEKVIHSFQPMSE